MRVSAAGKLLDAAGAPFVVRGAESWFGNSADPVGHVAQFVTIHANTMSPLVTTTNLAKVKALLDAARTAKLVMFFNPDQGGQRTFLLQAATVALLKQYEATLVLNLETELSQYDVQTASQASAWVADRQAMVRALRAAGYRCPIRIGSPNSGRSPSWALSRGAEILAADPEKNVFFAFQEYWGESWYENINGFVAGDVGRLAALRACAAGPLCFVVGFDATDDVGDTHEPLLRNAARDAGLGYLHWEMVDPGGSDDDVFTGSGALTDVGKALAAQFAAESKPATAGF